MEITNEERREVATRLRCNAQLCPNALFDLHETVGDSTYTLGGIATRLADLIDRPTCKPKDRYRGYVDAVCDSFCCPNCGFEIDVHIGEEQHLTEAAKYCPECGAEVVE